MKLDDLIRTAMSRVDAVVVRRTAINPLLWLSGLVTPLSLVLAAVAADRQTALLLFCLASAPVLLTFVAYFIFMFWDPDRLQSEEFRIRQQALKMLRRKGDGAEIVEVAKHDLRIESSHSGKGDNA
jgi:hypothetical protein